MNSVQDVDATTWRRTVASSWLRALLWLLVPLSVAGAVLCAWQAPRSWGEEKAARDAGAVVADVEGVDCALRTTRRTGSRRVCSVSLRAETPNTTVSTVVERTGRPELDGPEGRETTVIYVHPETGRIWFDDHPPGSEASALLGFACALAGAAAGLVIVLRAEMHLTTPFIPSSAGALGRVGILVGGGVLGALFAPFVGWWALVAPAVVLAVVAVQVWREPIALEVVIGRIVLHRRGGRRRSVRLMSHTITTVHGGRDPVIVVRRGTRRVRIASGSWAARGALLKELERCLALSGAPVPHELDVARLHVRGW